MATDVPLASTPIRGDAMRNPRRAPDEKAAMPECEPWVSSLAARNSSGNSDDSPRPVMNSPTPAPTGDGASVATSTPTAARAAPAATGALQAVAVGDVVANDTPDQHPAGHGDEAQPRGARTDIETIGHQQRGPLVGGSLGEGDGEADEEQPADDRP